MDGMLIFWLGLLIVMLVVEACTFALLTIWFAVGALGALIAAACGFSPLVQVIVFCVLSAVLLALLMPFTKKTLATRKQPTNADRIVGAEGVVQQEIDEVDGTGQVKVMGNVWSAKTENGGKIAVGERVDVVRIAGVKAVVKRKEQ